MYNVNIIGAGFVGLTLAEVLCKQDNISEVRVYDVDKNKIDMLRDGKCYVSEKDLTLKSDKLWFTDNICEVCTGPNGIYFICVGTPNENGDQNFSYVESAIDAITELDRCGTIILKSTTLPSNIDKVINQLEGTDTTLITNPEFLAEGTAVHDMMNQYMLVIGARDEDKDKAIKLLTDLFKDTYKDVKIVGIHEAMIIKYFLNCYKATKLTFINEIAQYCQGSGFKFSEVKDAVNEDPVLGKGFDIPGIGFGGSCFPKDCQAFGRISTLGMVVNELNAHIIESTTNVIHESAKGLNILIVGKAFKNGTNDLRYSIGNYIGTELSSDNNVSYYDSVPELCDLTLDEIKDNPDQFDLVIVVNDIPEVIEIFEGSDKLINTRKFN